MSREWNPKKFDFVYAEFICRDDAKFGLSGPVDYSLRYRSRFKTLIERFAKLAPATPIDVLDVGGGQLALLCNKLWNDSACVADLDRILIPYLQVEGIE